MLRGFRWQFVALIGALLLFSTVLILNGANTPAPTPIQVEPSATQAPPTQTVAPSITPEPVTAVLLTAINAPDAVVTFREGVVGQVERFNPLLQGQNAAEDSINRLIFEGLVTTNSYGEPIPLLATEWIVASNRIEYVFRLRQDVLWQDGVPFTAGDVAFTVGLLSDTASSIDPQVTAFWQTVEVEVLGDHLIRFRLTQPLGSFLDVLQVGILPEHALQGVTADQVLAHPFNLSPIGTGAYQLEALRTTTGNRIDAVDLRLAPTYRLRDPQAIPYTIERMRFQIYPGVESVRAAFEAGELDGLLSGSTSERQSLLTLNDANQYTQLAPRIGFLLFNWQRPAEGEAPNPFRDPRVRSALTLGLNQDSIIERNMVNVAVPANNPLLPGTWGYSAALQFPTYDLTTAQTLLQRANLTADATSTAPLISATLLVPDIAPFPTIADEIRQQWGLLNVQITPEVVDATTYAARLDNSEFDMALVEFSLGNSADPDPYAFWHQGQYPDGANYGAVDDRRISEIVERARRDPFGLNRIDYYRTFQAEFIDRAIAIPLYYPLMTYTVRNNVEGVQLGVMGVPSDRFRNLNEWVITP
ncbi:MAG: ABC transporter substrate-binding protein [Phototrophicaceae bacterium]